MTDQRRDHPWAASFVLDLRDGADLTDAVRDAGDRPRTFMWRGVANLAWPLDTGLFRRVSRHRSQPAGEAEVAAEEARLLEGARRLQFDRRGGFRLTDLELLASLQHHGAATRLLDVSANAMISMWFATEDRTQDDVDGALFAIDVTNRELPPDRETGPIGDLVSDQQVWLWRPPPVEDRIRVQQGAFIFSGVPDPLPTQTSLALELTSWSEATTGSTSDRPLVAFRIPADAKPRLRTFLATLLGYDAESLYPDLPGYANARRA